MRSTSWKAASPVGGPARAKHEARGSGLVDTIKRLRAVGKAGADVLFAPGQPGLTAFMQG